MEGINWLGGLVAGAVASLGIGSLWFGPLFGKIWMAETGFTHDKKPRYAMPVMMGGSALISVIAAWCMSRIIGHADAMHGLKVGAIIGLVFGGGAIATNYLWESKSLRHIAVNAGYVTAQMALIGLILGIWRNY